MSTDRRVTVAEAIALTGRSKSSIYRVIGDGKVYTEDSTDGVLIDLIQLRDAFASKKRGRPRKAA